MNSMHKEVPCSISVYECRRLSAIGVSLPVFFLLKEFDQDFLTLSPFPDVKFGM